jgi:hypothetical protein
MLVYAKIQPICVSERIKAVFEIIHTHRDLSDLRKTYIDRLLIYVK